MIAPAFSSSRQVAAFAVLLAGLLALPALVARTGWLQRRDVYPSIPWKYLPAPWIQQQIFEQTNDVDIAFLGSSHIWNGVDTPFVQQQLSAQLGRPAEVFTLGWPWPGFDALYVIAADLLERRRVRMLVIYDDFGGAEGLHLHSARWFRVGEHSEVLGGLPWTAQAGLYGGALLGMPRHLLSLVRANRLEEPAHCATNLWNTYYSAPNLAGRLGSLRAGIALHYLPGLKPFHPDVSASPSNVVIYSEATRDQFKFTGPPTPPYQRHFAEKLAQLCREQGTRLVVMHMPELAEWNQTTIAERELWSDEWKSSVDLIGIPGRQFFTGIAADERQKLFYDPKHLNQNGQDLFTALITPTLLKLYATTAN